MQKQSQIVLPKMMEALFPEKRRRSKKKKVTTSFFCSLNFHCIMHGPDLLKQKDFTSISLCYYVKVFLAICRGRLHTINDPPPIFAKRGALCTRDCPFLVHL